MKLAVLVTFSLIFVFVQSAEWRASNWILIWSDEFDGPNGSGPDETKWAVESGGNGWGNNELQYYTARRENVRQENGNLIIEATKAKFTGPDGIQRDYTSARMNTAERFSQQYGRFEVRTKIPSEPGVSSAFWLLGNDFWTKGWPDCGEIDVMENVGLAPSEISGSIHGAAYFAGNALTSRYTLSKARFSDDFHVFAAEWEPQRIRFYVDGQLYADRTPSDLPPGAAWVFDHPFFLLLNVAVGGNLSGKPHDSTVFPQRMLVDYVRVYSRR